MKLYSAPEMALLAQTYSSGTGVTLTALGDRIIRNRHLFPRLLDNKGCTLETAERVSRWFLENWPSEVPWPENVRRLDCEAA